MFPRRPPSIRHPRGKSSPVRSGRRRAEINQRRRTALGGRSVPRRKDLLGLDHLFRRTGEVDIELSRPARDLDLDRFQPVLLHTITELLVDFVHWVLLEIV